MWLTAIIEEVIPDKISADKRKQRVDVVDAILAARSYSDDQVNQFLVTNEREVMPYAKKHNLTHELTYMEGKRNLIEKYAMEFPNKFTNTQILDSPVDTDKAADLVKACAKSGLISFDQDTREWKNEGTTIHKVSRKPNQQNRELAIYLTSTEKGKEWLKLLKQKAGVD